jgi:hypothetical protein
MSDERALSRPIGWWLKEADVLLDAAFDQALEGEEVDRRDWQVLASLSTGAKIRDDVVAGLSPFDPPAVVEDVIRRLCGRGWVQDQAATLQLTPAGVERQQSLAPRVRAVRHRIAAALPQDDYVALVGLLARLVDALGPSARGGVEAP